MAMNAADLETRIIDLMEAAHNEKYSAEPSVVGVNVTQIPKEDGTVESDIEYVQGTPDFDREGVVPLARAIAGAVVEHITTHAEVEDNGVGGTPAGTWRIS